MASPQAQSATSSEVKRKAAREVIDILHEIATLLNTNLDRQQLSYCVSLIENGANPEALAKVIRQLREEYPEPEDDEDAGAEAGAAAR
ncbi:mitotic-spindle organizing gamma-tubulin ring associated-domain-containing protein [Lophiotrema nucula]|uniref:Mitotic-spindle organizing protein 1 n=1 Tax=Lophiotrema nucula TaxID=690887 RepID=A0A6A5ZTI8_9PLEO|nr:mitotic-spindle organizing gamma-tubulin ring associated-domain-containing protein [Lophiotrema nucula]